MKIYLGADHRGFNLKEDLKAYLSQNFEVEDLGAKSFVDNDDFVEYAIDVATKTSQNKEDKGIVICGSGAGVEIAANKVRGTRCSLGQSEEQIAKAREADNINILAIAADFTDFEKVKKFVETFLNTEYIPNENHNRRLEKIVNLENE